MKKLKALMFTFILSAMLVANVFASAPGDGGVLSFLSSAYESVMSLFDEGSGSCPLRQCTTCRPQERDENGNCRPRD